MVEGMEIMETSFKRSHVPASTLSASNPAAGHHQPTPSPETPGHSQARSWSWTDLWRPIRPSRTNTQKRCLFHFGDLNAKVRHQEISGVTGKFGLGVWNEAGQRLIEFCQENTLVIANTIFSTEEKTLHITKWSTPKSNWLYSLQPKMVKLYTVSKNKTRSWLWLRSWTPYYQIQT